MAGMMMGSSPFCKSMDMVDVCTQLMRDGGGVCVCVCVCDMECDMECDGWYV